MTLSELVRGGNLRVAFNEQNIMLIQCNNASGTRTGVGADMARELARAMRVQAFEICHTDGVALFDAGRRGEWDVAFVVASPGQAAMDFTRPYIMIEQTYLVPAGSPV
jgi:polar amino acid transport system substrate-binding protein